MNNEFEGLGLIELLDLLEPAPEPVPISWMPQTAGWIWLGLAVIVALFMGIRQLIRHRRANAYRRAGLAALRAVGDDPTRIATVIRRTALAGFPRSQIAGRTGEAWLRFLDDTMAGSGFATGAGRVLIEAPYKSAGQIPDYPSGLSELAQQWIRKHTVPKPADKAKPE